MRLYRPAHEILVLVANAQKPPLNTQNEVSSWSSDLIFDLSFHLYPYFVHQYTRAAKVLANTHICAGSFVYSMLDNAIGIKISYAEYNL